MAGLVFTCTATRCPLPVRTVVAFGAGAAGFFFTAGSPSVGAGVFGFAAALFAANVRSNGSKDFRSVRFASNVAW